MKQQRTGTFQICPFSTFRFSVYYKTLNADTQRRAVADSNIEIIRGGGRRWKGSQLFWRNICILASKLPSDGQGDIIFDAMRRYPQSVLVFSGLQELFGRDKAIGSTKGASLLPSGKGNAIARFDPRRHNRALASAWFEKSALTRLQETAVHMTAAAEYIFRCAYQACYESGHRCAKYRFMLLLRSNIVLDGDDKTGLTIQNFPCKISGT